MRTSFETGELASQSEVLSVRRHRNGDARPAPRAGDFLHSLDHQRLATALADQLLHIDPNTFDLMPGFARADEVQPFACRLETVCGFGGAGPRMADGIQREGPGGKLGESSRPRPAFAKAGVAGLAISIGRGWRPTTSLKLKSFSVAAFYAVAPDPCPGKYGTGIASNLAKCHFVCPTD